MSARALTLIYGTQSGTSMQLARQLAQECSLNKAFKSVDVLNAKDLQFQRFFVKCKAEQDTLVFMQSTFGQGEPTDNSKHLFEYLQGLEPSEKPLRNVRYSVFGCGKSLYADRYQAAARWLDGRLQELGATQVAPRGEGDDSNDIEDDFDRWSRAFLQQYPAEAGESAESAPAASTPRAPLEGSLAFLTHVPSWRPFELFAPALPIDVHNPYPATLLHRRLLTRAGARRAVYHLEFDTARLDGLKYAAGDYLGIYPRNSPDSVASVCKRLGLDLAQPFAVRDLGGSLRGPLAMPLRVEDYFSSVADVAAPLSNRTLLRAVVGCAGDDATRFGVEELAKKRVGRRYSTFLDALEAFPSLHVPLETLVGAMPLLQPRYYSIASDPRRHPGEVHLCVGECPGPAPGVCSSYLASCKEGSRVPVFVRQSLFRLPQASEAGRVVLVGAGTGVAPIRSFWQALHQQHKAARRDGTKPPQLAKLYFGCDGERDWLYRGEMLLHEDFHELEVKSAFNPVFAQHRMEEDADEIAQWVLRENARIFICGHPALYNGVKESMAKILKNHVADPKEYIENMIQTNRFQADIY